MWNQPYISRFNEEGKKSKSKGNHIWHVDAKKSESGWLFRPFQRRLAGAPPGVAYVGLRWTWTPRIWDPQASRANMPVSYSSQSLPPWLAWKDDVLSGIPPPDAQSCDVTVEARVGFYIFVVFVFHVPSLTLSRPHYSSRKTERKRFSRTLCISPLPPWQLSMRHSHHQDGRRLWAISTIHVV